LINDKSVKETITQFQIAGYPVAIATFGSGNINDTFKVLTNTGGAYLLQRVNHQVFRDIPGLTQNLIYITSHLKEKLKQISGADPEAEVLTPIETISDNYFIKDAFGNYWRMFLFLKGTKSYDIVTTEKQAREGGSAFGRFQYLLADLDPAIIVETIPLFHNIAYRLTNLDKAIEANKVNRLKLVSEELLFINERRITMNNIPELGKAGKLPLRIIHNDTKFNNVLLNENDKAQCVIDLDTVMPGFVAYDFGDAIRTIINTAAEDEADLVKINLNIPLFSAYVKGYFEQTKDLLTATEVATLFEGALLLPYMQAVRFLTDYLEGDTYFKIHFPEHNLQRAKAQIQLVKLLETKKTELNTIILKAWNEKLN